MKVLEAASEPFMACLPRNVENFYEGIDNLSPLGHLRESIYTPLASAGKPVGVLQLLNKKRG